MKLKLSILFILGIWQLSQAQALFQARLDTDKIEIGQPVSVTLYAELNADDTEIWPLFTDSLNGLEVWEIGEVSEKVEKDKKLIQQKLVVTSFDSGYYIIKPIALTVGRDTLFTDPLLIQVNTIALDEQNELYGIKAPVKAPFSWTLILIVGAGVMILALILFFILKMRKGKYPLQANKIVDTRTPLEKLQERLTQIKREKNWESQVKLFYSQLSDAVKHYIEDEEKFAAVESTTMQLKPIIMAMPWKPQTRLNIIELLEESDMVKFAKAKPVLETHQMHLLAFEDWFQEVKQIRLLKNVPNTKVND